jgi:protease I
MVTGEGLGILKSWFAANAEGRRAYDALSKSPEFRRPHSWEELRSPDPYSALILPGGHKSEGMRPYLESQALQAFVAKFIETGRPLAAICHGVVLAARSTKGDGKSILHGRKVTALPRWMELSAWTLTRAWLGDYYRTYRDKTVESEVRSVLADPGRDFQVGPRSSRRDKASKPELGFVVRDGNLLTARWPGDANRFGQELLSMIPKDQPKETPSDSSPA